MKKRTRSRVLKPILIALGALLGVVMIYLGYVILTYSRLPDNLALRVEGEAGEDKAYLDREYVIVTQNLGFGAYTADFTFFMDGGTQSRGESAESVAACILAGGNTVLGLEPDFVLFQEVDLDSTRSFHMDQYAMLCQLFPDWSRCYAQNYDSAYLMYPFTQPHGASKSALATFSSVSMTSSLRRSLPISQSLSKFLDLDRCYSVSRVEVENGKELVLYNVHSSAYGGNDEIRAAQMTMLLQDMKGEYDKGNYVICGGDFNHDFTGDSTQTLNGYGDLDYGWAQPFPAELIPEGLSRCINYKDGLVGPTCRNCDIPYEQGNFTIIVDGFLISDNVECVEVENVVTGFVYSDHNPVVLTFKLS